MSAVAPGVCAGASAVCLVVGVRRLAVQPGRPMASVRLGRWAPARRLGVTLRRAGLPVTAEVAVLAVVAAMLVAGGAMWVVLGTAVGAAIACGMVFAAAVAFVRSADRRYLARFTAQLALVAQQLAGGLAAGLSLRQSIERTARDVPQPASIELGRLATELRLGARVEPALAGFAERLADPAVRLLVTAIVVQRSVGGNLAEGLARLAAQLDDRERLMREARSATAQARMSAWLVAGLPAVGGLAVELAAPGTLERTLGHGPGRILLALAALLEFLGVVLVRRITTDVVDSGGHGCPPR